MPSIEINARNGYHDRDEASASTGLHCRDESLAVQSQAEEANINTIVRNFGVTGLLPQVLALPTYGDFEGVSDYHQAQTLIALAQSSFMELPSGIRAEFDNDSRKFVDFVEDPNNAPALAELGIERVDGRSLITVTPPPTAGEIQSSIPTPTPPPTPTPA